MVRTRLLLITVFSLAAAMGVVTFGYYLVLSHQLEAGAAAELRVSADAAVAGVEPRGDTVVFRDRAGSDAVVAGVWVFDASGRVVAQPQVGSALDQAAGRLVGVPAETYADSTPGHRLLAVPVERGGQRIATVVVGAPTAPYENAERTALLTAIAWEFVLLALVAAGVRRLTTSALRPVALMTEQAEGWGVHDLKRRFRLGEGTDELTHLARTFDDLFDRLETSLRAEQRLTAEIAHELRTPMSRMETDVDIALRHERSTDEYREVLVRTGDEIRGLAQTIESLLASARSHQPGLGDGCDAVAVTADVVSQERPHAEARGVRLSRSNTAEHEVRASCDAETARRALLPVVANAVAYAGRTVDVTVTRTEGWVVVRVDDDGPGVAPAERDDIFEPGVRGDAAATTGSGLGLALARRLARSVGGDVVVGEADGGRFELRLPASPDA